MALINCRECENKISTEATVCPRCGAPQKPSLNVATAPPATIATERTESTVVQVAPSYENEKIKEMEVFSWNLQSRQEIVEEGNSNTEGRSSILNSGSYVVKTRTAIHKYVKLHFVRSASLPNLNEIKRLEAEYLSLVPPEIPDMLPSGIPWATVRRIKINPPTHMEKMLPNGIPWIFFWPYALYHYFVIYKSKKTEAESRWPGILRQKEEILQKVASL